MKYAYDFEFLFEENDSYSKGVSGTILQSQFANVFNTLDNLFTFDIEINFAVPYWLAISMRGGKYFSIITESDALQKANNLEDSNKNYAVEEIMSEVKIYQKIYELSNGDNMNLGNFKKMLNLLQELNKDIDKAMNGKWKFKPYTITWYEKWSKK